MSMTGGRLAQRHEQARGVRDPVEGVPGAEHPGLAAGLQQLPQLGQAGRPGADLVRPVDDVACPVGVPPGHAHPLSAPAPPPAAGPAHRPVNGGRRPSSPGRPGTPSLPARPAARLRSPMWMIALRGRRPRSRRPARPPRAVPPPRAPRPRWVARALTSLPGSVIAALDGLVAEFDRAGGSRAWPTAWWRPGSPAHAGGAGQRLAGRAATGRGHGLPDRIHDEELHRRGRAGAPRRRGAAAGRRGRRLRPGPARHAPGQPRFTAGHDPAAAHHDRWLPHRRPVGGPAAGAAAG